MLFLIGIGTGYRLQDLVGLLIADLKDAIEDGYLEIQESKQYNQWKAGLSRYPNRKRPNKRKVELGRSLTKIIKGYVRDKKRSEYAFPSRKGGHITQEYFSKVLKDIGKELDLENISGHSLRKTYVTTIYEKTGNDIVKAKNAIGHKSIEETRRYIGENDKDVRKATEIIEGII
ncbi:tyrosine-type recombinase/integrase [Clostridium baratii]|uniref:tyrosine-type recombinase/integrase n=1 Tax=Clostridium baratii TaxID=1561 RepID=UPI0030D257BF